MAHEGGMLLDDMERSVLDPVAERNHSAHPDALLLRRGDLVPDAFAGDFAFELGEGQQDVQGQSPHAGRVCIHLGDVVEESDGDLVGEAAEAQIDQRFPEPVARKRIDA